MSAPLAKGSSERPRAEAGPGSRAARMREERRRQIVAAARETFASRGYHLASINDIIGRAKIARGTFYLYFPSKRAVFESLLDEALLELRARITRVELGAGAPPPIVQLRANVERVLRYLLENRDFTRLLLALWLNVDAEVAATVGAFYEHAQDLIASSLRHGMRLGLLRACEPGLVAAALLGTIRGVTAHLLVFPGDLERAIDEILALALHGLGVAPRWGTTE